LPLLISTGHNLQSAFSAIDRDDLPGDEPGGIRTEPYYQLGHLFILAEPALKRTITFWLNAV
jgi:hypothetical protein